MKRNLSIYLYARPVDGVTGEKIQGRIYIPLGCSFAGLFPLSSAAGTVPDMANGAEYSKVGGEDRESGSTD